MKAGWEVKALEKCLDPFKVKAKIPRKKFKSEGAFPIVSQEADFVNGYWDEPRDVCRVLSPVVVFGDHTQVLKYVDFDFVVGADGVKVLNPKSFLSAKFLQYFIEANPFPSLGYARHFRHVKSLPIPLPPLDEQKRIVAVLDAAFEGLTRARTHVETNLQNARELFASKLRETFCVEQKGWSLAIVGDTFAKTKVPSKIQRKRYLSEGAYPIVSQEAGLINGYWDLSDDVVKVHKPLVVFGDHTRSLKYVDFDFVVGADGTQLLLPKAEFDSRFYFYALRSIDLAGKGYARHFSHLKKEPFWYPAKLLDQAKLGLGLERLEATLETTQDHYRAKLQDLDDLRQSLLQKAFAGELT